jgi:CheY-like chemotaxis protein
MTTQVTPTRDEKTSRPLVVVVDDDDDVRDLLSGRFSDAGYDVITAANGPDAINLLAGDLRQMPAAIFVDFLMPGVVGTSVLDFVRSERRFAGVPVAVVTGAPQLVPPGVVVFAKPARFDALLAYVHDHRVSTARNATIRTKRHKRSPGTTA